MSQGLRQFVILKEAWYSKSMPGAEPEINIGVYHPDDGGGTSGEFSIRWKAGIGAQLRVFYDAWAILAGRFRDLVPVLEELGRKPSPEQVAEALRGLGIEDATEREAPARSRAPAPKCPCCERAIEV